MNLDNKMKNIYEKYANFITNNSETTGDIEMLAKYMSYFVSGKLTDNSIVTEGLFSISNLVVQLNDYIIRKQLTKGDEGFSPVGSKTEDHLKLFLNVLESVEVLIEITSEKILGNARKFFIIFVIQAVKCISRLVLILKFKNRISQTPAIEHLDRKNLSNFRRPNAVDINNLQPEMNEQNKSITMKLKRSGKVIRKVAHAPPLYTRSFKAPEITTADDRFGVYNHRAIKNAEIIYILKPVLHLGSVGLFGYKSWKSYFLSLFLDVFSINQYYKNRGYLTPDQKKELSRRCTNMLLYILRSPFYDKYSGDKIDAFLKALSRIIPFSRLIIEPYRELIPHYQQMYGYIWCN